jgi:glycosyltransferase involved in cell wall biosynthesis
MAFCGRVIRVGRRRSKQEVEQMKKPTGSQALHIVWEGAFLARHSLALVNRELVLALHRAFPEWEFYLVPHPTDDMALHGDARWQYIEDRLRRLPSRVDVWVRHHWPPNWQRPEAERFIVIQPWEFGSIPRDWVDAINRSVDELWVPSNFVRDCYVRDGVHPDKVFVVPNGVSESFFEPVPPLELPTQKRFRFLFVGGSIPRKGIDILLDGYTRTFTRNDDVALVIKDFGTNTFYRGRNFLEQIRWFQRQPEVPEIVYIAEELDEQQMNALYRACHVLVHPYRGEGFGLPIAEAMACGLPVIVTDFGAAKDFCNAERAFLIPAEVEYFPDNLVDDMETVNRPFWAKPDRNAMEALMEQVFHHYDEAKGVGERAARWVRENLTWERAAQVAAERLGARLEKAAAGQSAETIILRAAEHVSQDNPSEAIVLLEKLIREDPSQLKAYCGLGVAYFQAGSIARAEGVLRQGLQHGEDFELHYHLAYILLQTGRSQEALRHATPRRGTESRLRGGKAVAARPGAEAAPTHSQAGQAGTPAGFTARGAVAAATARNGCYCPYDGAAGGKPHPHQETLFGCPAPVAVHDCEKRRAVFRGLPEERAGSGGRDCAGGYRLDRPHGGDCPALRGEGSTPSLAR